MKSMKHGIYNYDDEVNRFKNRSSLQVNNIKGTNQHTKKVEVIAPISESQKKDKIKELYQEIFKMSSEYRSIAQKLKDKRRECDSLVAELVGFKPREELN